MELAAVGADAALPKSGSSVGISFIFDDGPAVRIAPQRLDRLQIVEGGRVDAGLDHRRLAAAVRGGELLGERAVAVAQVPVPGLRQHQPASRCEAEGMDLGDRDEETREALSALRDAELRGLLDGVGEVAARIGKPDDFRLRGLGLQQEGAGIGGRQRGWRTRPTTLPFMASTTAAVSRSSTWPKA